jgi:hypothetical protein
MSRSRRSARFRCSANATPTMSGNGTVRYERNPQTALSNACA